MEISSKDCNNGCKNFDKKEELDYCQKFCGLDSDEDEESVGAVAKALNDAGIKFECVEQEGGEGEGDVYYTVYKFTKDDEEQFVKFNGWYASYHGSEMNDYAFVVPKKVEVIVYE